ncbi:MAG: hypothetical protein AAF234_00590 [Pseudomonadota bacterium]
MVRILFVLGFLLFMPSAQAQQALPDDLVGDWGEPGQCGAQAEAGADETVDHVMDAPYRFQGASLSRWYFYCLVMQVDPMRDGGWRVRALCGEDAVERPWEIDIAREGDTLSMTWFAIGEEEGAARPWAVGPFQRCTAEQS